MRRTFSVRVRSISASSTLALSVGADPHPFLLGMAICTSAGFSTPWAHESTLLVFGPGRYQMKHYLALGIPFTVISWLVTITVLPARPESSLLMISTRKC